MPLDLIGSVAIFLLTIFGLGWPLAGRFALPPVERLLATAGLSLLGVFLLAWGVYVLGLPANALWILPVLALIGLASGPKALAALVQDPDTRALFSAYLLVTLWCVAWLATVVSYSGGGWAGDWFEHWERSRFFLERWPHERMFLVIYPLPARPPLANVVTGAFLHLTRVDFAHYQLFSTLLAGLVFLPAAVIARRFLAAVHRGDDARPDGAGRTMAVLAVLFMVNPLFVQNATFAWTKLPAAFLVLASLHFFLRAHEPGAPRAAGPLCAALIGAALITHYSAGPYAVVLVAAWLALGWARRRDPAWWRETALAALIGALVLAAWFGWSLAIYGAGGTLLSNSSVTTVDATPGSQIAKIALNLRDTLVPHFLRTFDQSLIAQSSPWGWWHDWFFQSYQLNLLFACGSVAWLAILRELGRARRGATPAARRFWTVFVLAIFLLGVGTHGARDLWGLAHICLQPLILLGLAFLGARWAELGRGWRLALVAGAVVDLLAGVALHFAVQNYALDRLLTPGRDLREVVTSYNSVSAGNTFALAQNELDTFAVAFGSPAPVVIVILTGLLALALIRARQRTQRGGPGSQ
jgi:hypothetical protein